MHAGYLRYSKLGYVLLLANGMVVRLRLWSVMVMAKGTL
jgi:hypothetical protein